MFNYFKKALPKPLKRYIYNKYIKLKYLNGNYYCPVCDTSIKYFEPFSKSYLEDLDRYGYIHSIFTTETFNLFAYNCPACGTSDRNRLYTLFIDKMCSNLEDGKKYTFIDFAPNASLARRLRSNPHLSYRSADLYASNVDDNVDITDMTIYGDNFIDSFLCSHVLEHVSDDMKALKELYRILKPGGWGIVMVPINLALTETCEDSTKITEEERWKYFGQGDHLRLYAKQDFLQKLQAAGFTVHQYGIDFFGEDTFNRCGIHKRSVLYKVEK